MPIFLVGIFVVVFVPIRAFGGWRLLGCSLRHSLLQREQDQAPGLKAPLEQEGAAWAKRDRDSFL